MIEKVYVVKGSAEGWGGDLQWPIIAYADEKLAQEHIRRAQAYVNTICTEAEAAEDWRTSQKIRNEAVNPYDPEIKTTWNPGGIHYTYDTVEIASKLKVWETSAKEDER